MEENLKVRNITLARIGKVLQVNNAVDGIDFFAETVKELTANDDDPRIIIVNTNFAAMLACTLYDAGLYGPKYVYLWTGLTHPQPNSKYGPADCTGEMIAQIVRSVIIFNQGTPLNLKLNMTDAIGMSPKEYDKELKLRTGQPDMDLDAMWFPWRLSGYSPAVGAALVVEEVHKALKAKNDSLLNWVANSENFQTNSSFIHEMFKYHFEHFKYNGLGTYGNVEISRSTGVTGFYQMQQEDPTQWKTESFEIVPVATYDANTKEFKEMRPIKWLTFNGKAPFDSPKIVKQQDNFLPISTSAPLLTISAILAICNIGIIIKLALTKEGNWAIPFNFMIAFASLISLIFLPLLANVNDNKAAIYCMVGSVCLIVGQCLILLSLFGKLYISYVVFTKIQESKKKVKQTVNTEEANEMLKKAIKKRKQMLAIIVAMVSVTLILAIVWMAISPMTVINNEKSRDLSDYHPDIYIVHYTFDCSIEMNAVNEGFIFTLIALHLLFLINSLRIAFVANKVLINLVADVNHLRITIYIMATVMLAGGAVTWMMFSQDSYQIVSATSILNILIITMTTIFQIVNLF